MSEVCQQYRVELGHRPIPSNRLEIQSYRRVNSPGLPNASLRSSCKGSKKRMEIGLVTDRKLSESPLFDQMLSTGKIKTKLQNECESKTPSPKLSPPQMEPQAKRNLRMIEKLESDQLCLKIYMSEEDQNQLVFTGISKQKMQSPNQNKKIILQNLQQLFLNGIQGQNQYIKLESLEQQLNQEKEEKQEYHGITNRFPGKRMNTIGHDTKSILDRSLSISTIKEYKSNTSSKINKDIEMIEQGLQRYKLQTKNKNNGKSKKQQPLGQHNCTISLKQKQNTSRSPFLKNGSSPSFCTQRKTEQRGTNKLKQNTKSMHA